MSTAFENFGLSDLVAKPEDALRLASLAALEGQKIRGYFGNYFLYQMGDASAIVRTAMDYDTNESELLGLDTHGASSSIWECTIQEDVTPSHFDVLERRLLLSSEKSGSLALVDLVNADVLPAFYPGTPIRLNMVAFPQWVEYHETEEAYLAAQKEKKDGENIALKDGGIFSVGYLLRNDPNAPKTDLEENYVLLRGMVKDVKVGKTYMGMEPMTEFISATVSTQFGDIEVCHATTAVKEEQKDSVKVGSILSTLCILSGNPAIGAYAGGIRHNEEEDLALLRYFFEKGGAHRLRPALHSECTYHSDYSGQSLTGIEPIIALLQDVESALDAESRYFAYPAVITSVVEDGKEPAPLYMAGKKCLLLAQGGPEQYVAICFVDTDSVGRIKAIRLSQDGRYRFQRTDMPEDPFAATEPPKDALEAMVPFAVMANLIKDPAEVTADTSSFPAFTEKAKEAVRNWDGSDEGLKEIFGSLYLSITGEDAAQGKALCEGFLLYHRLAKPDKKTYEQQLLNALVLVQRFGQLSLETK